MSRGRAVVLRALGKSHADIARTLGIPKATVYYWLRSDVHKAFRNKRRDTQLGGIRYRIQMQRCMAKKRGHTGPAFTEQEAIALFDGKCRICKVEGTWKTLCIDHCHQTGLLRGWLCQRCNRVLGSIEDDADLLETMIGYLKKKKEE